MRLALRATIYTCASQNSLNLSLSPGARITGQVLGQIGPAGGLRVKVVQFDRRAERYLGVYTATTKEDGTFTVEDATPGEEYIVSGAIKDFEAIGAPFTKRVTVAESSTDIGQLRLKKGFAFRGGVSGVKLPTSTTIFVHRLGFPDAPEMKLDDRGRFEFRNLPEDSYEVWVKGAGIALSPENASIDPINPAVLCGRINADKSTLKILVDTTSSPKPPNLARLSRERRLAIIEAHRRLLSAPIAGIE